MKSKDKDGINLQKEAKCNKTKGDNEIKSSCISCRFKPNCHDAIPFYKIAATQYHNLRDFNEEIYCREKLAFCFRTVNSEWEEGKEYEQIALIYLNQLSNPEGAYKSAQNAHQSYFIKADYRKSITLLNNLSDMFLKANLSEYSEKCLKLAFDDCLTVFHTLAMKKDENVEFIYTCFDCYIDYLFKARNFNTIFTVCESILKVILPYENIKSKIIKYYAYKMLAALISEDKIGYETYKSEATKAVNQHGYGDSVEIVDDMKSYIYQEKEVEFKRNLPLLEAYFNIEIVKQVKDLFNKFKENNKVITNIDDIKLITNKEPDEEQNGIIIEQDSNDFT